MPITHETLHGSIRLTGVYSILYTVHYPLIGFFKQRRRKSYTTVRSTTLEPLSLHIMLAEVQFDKISHKPYLLSTGDLRYGVLKSWSKTPLVHSEIIDLAKLRNFMKSLDSLQA